MLVYLLSGNRDFLTRFFDRNTFINSHLDISFYGQFFPCILKKEYNILKTKQTEVEESG